MRPQGGSMEKPNLMEQMVTAIRVRDYSRKTERA